MRLARFRGSHPRGRRPATSAIPEQRLVELNQPPSCTLSWTTTDRGTALCQSESDTARCARAIRVSARSAAGYHQNLNQLPPLGRRFPRWRLRRRSWCRRRPGGSAAAAVQPLGVPPKPPPSPAAGVPPNPSVTAAATIAGVRELELRQQGEGLAPRRPNRPISRQAPRAGPGESPATSLLSGFLDVSCMLSSRCEDGPKMFQGMQHGLSTIRWRPC